MNQPMAPLNQPWQLEPNPGFMLSEPFGYNPRIRDVPLDVYVQEGQTGRFSLGGSVNSDLGVAGQVSYWRNGNWTYSLGRTREQDC